MTGGRRRSWPLFLRIFAVLLASVVVVQLASYALLVAAGPPAANFRTLDEIAAAMRAGVDRRGDLEVTTADAPPDMAEPSPFSRALAARLNLPEERVRVAHERSWRGGPRPFFRPPPRRAGHDARAEVLAGRFVAAFRRSDGRWLTVRPLRSEMEIWRRDTLLWIVAAALALTPFAWLLARWLARPITLFAAAAERLGRDPHAPLLAVEGPREIKHAADTFNEMQRRLSQYVEDRTMLIGAIAHDMRTPLMRLSLRLRDASVDLRADVERDIAEMQAMIAAATAFVRDATRPAERRPLELCSLVESVVDEAADQGADVSLRVAEPITLHGHPATLKAMISNLVDNAVKYAGSTEVSLRREGRLAVIEVRDHGPGIAQEDLPRIFEPFFRGERSRNPDTGGLGLGLASARAVARSHGGDVTITNLATDGVAAKVQLPLSA